ncbi:Rrf2 family transcriptional regulator [Candidatus Acetothermia bacterium]|nr:Rrf2 family transcriptional regulator [Candidatus Acetothermia bacterium]MBI3642814.1 Rrf2 family transcriptional regulator [Candidatus Acetothermia bacterium]
MRLSRESQYGLSGLVYLALKEPGKITQVAEISEQASLPKAFLAKIFRKLALYGVLQSYRGRDRGFRLSRPASEIKIREIIEAIEGPDFFQRCIFWSGQCSNQSPCMLHGLWKSVRPQVAERVSLLTLQDVAENSPVLRNEALI